MRYDAVSKPGRKEVWELGIGNLVARDISLLGMALEISIR